MPGAGAIHHIKSVLAAMQQLQHFQLSAFVRSAVTEGPLGPQLLRSTAKLRNQCVVHVDARSLQSFVLFAQFDIAISSARLRSPAQPVPKP
jgi:hypothetical protein